MSAILSLLGLLGLAGTAMAADLPVEIQVQIDRALAEDLPAQAVEGKAVEGLAKGVPAERIAPVLERLVTDLAHARALLGPVDSDALVGGARALKAGASEEALRLVQERSAGASRSQHTLADLLTMGMSESDAVRVVRAASRTNDPERDLAAVVSTAAAMVSRGSRPETVAVQLVGAMDAITPGVGSLPDDGPGKADPKGKALGLGNVQGSKGSKAGGPK